MQAISLNKLRSALREVLQQVAESDEPIVVTWKGEALAEISPPSAKALAASLAVEVAKPSQPSERPKLTGLPKPTEPPRPVGLPKPKEPEASTPIEAPPESPAPKGGPPVGDPPEEEEERRPRRRRRARRRRTPAAEEPEAEMAAVADEAPRRPERAPAVSASRAEPSVDTSEIDEDNEVDEDEENDAPKVSRRLSATFRAIPQHPVDTIEGSFEALGLSEPILRQVREIGFERPTPIQAAVIPAALKGGDMIGLAQTGSGKTAAFCLPLAERLVHGKGVRGLILSPTREIALQTKAFLDLFGRDHKLKTVCLIGGVPLGPQITGLRKEPDILVATPGRLLDHVRRRNVRLDKIEELVLDEADHMLDLGFLPQIVDVLEYIPTNRRTMMFSATMPPDIERLVQRLMTDPTRVDILPEGGAAEGISHRLYLVTEEEEKKKCAISLLNQELGSTLVFIRRKVDAEWLTGVLEREGHPVERIHSDLSQSQRVRALSSFREGQHRILVATDIAARGLDVPIIQHVINFDLPDQVEDYIHRAGRTARGTLRGTVSSICTWKDKIMVREIEAALGEEIPRCTVPGAAAYVERKTAAVGRGRHKLKTRRRL